MIKEGLYLSPLLISSLFVACEQPKSSLTDLILPPSQKEVQQLIDQEPLATVKKEIPSFIVGMKSIADKLFFFATTGNNHLYLWRSDGTHSGTKPIKWLFSAGSSNVLRDGHITYIHELQGKLFFQLTEREPGFSLPNKKSYWVSDGSFKGTFSINKALDKQFTPNFWHLTPLKDHAYFTGSGLAFTENKQIKDKDFEIWKSDGTLKGTKSVTTLWSSGHANIWEMTPLKDHIYFTTKSLKMGKALWQTDGTHKGTQIIIPPSKEAFISSPFVFKKRLYFYKNGFDKTELCYLQSDKSPPAYKCPLSIGEERALQTIKTKTSTSPLLFFLINKGASFSLWVSDGSPQGTLSLKDFNLDIFSLSSMTSSSHAFYFIEHEKGCSLITSDGSKANTLFLKKFNNCGVKESLGSLILFNGETDDMGDQLWVSDGTMKGTIRLTSLNGSEGAGIYYMTPFKDKVYFSVSGAEGKSALWYSDGSKSGTAQVK